MPHDVSVPCPVCQMPRSFHGECFSAALSWIAHVQYDSPAEHHLARRLAPTCYLCGTAATTDVEHVVPRQRDGSDTWGNVAGACRPCNRDKWHRPATLTVEQQHRWAQQQANYQAAYARVTPEIVGTHLLVLARSPTWDALPPHRDEVIEAVEDELLMWTELEFTIERDLQPPAISFEVGGVIWFSPTPGG